MLHHEYVNVLTLSQVVVSKMSEDSLATWLAQVLGYLIGLGSLMLYTPMAIRLFRQKTADGTAMVTWMMKLSAYTATDLYSLWKKYPISTYIETVIITVEAIIILILVVIYQRRWRDPVVVGFTLAFVTISAYLYATTPPKLLELGQLCSAGLTSAALVPQFHLNFKNQNKGDYSPVTAALASLGCAARLFTVQQLADSDPFLFFSNGTALALNFSLFLQILYYGVVVEGLSVRAVLLADIHSPAGNDAYGPLTAEIEQGVTQEGHVSVEFTQATPEE